jgi:hypothetical protein
MFNIISNYCLIIQILNEIAVNDNTQLNISPRKNLNSLLIFPDLNFFNKYLEVLLNKIIIFEKISSFR